MRFDHPPNCDTLRRMADRRRTKRRKETQRIRTVRRAIVVSIAALAAAFGILGLLYGVGFAGAGEGEQYREIENAPQRRGPVTIVEYFSYSCIHCRNFDPLIEDWRETLPDGVMFRRAHVAFNPALELLAKAHVALTLHGALQPNHQRIFRAVHDRARQFADAEDLASYLDGYGIDRAAFLALMDSPRTARTVRENERAMRAAGVSGVPALVVAEKYVVNMDVGRKQALEVAERLARMALAAREGDAATEGIGTAATGGDSAS